jgi:hypothetical protein
LEYIRSCPDLWEKGLYAELGAYQHHVFMDWRFVAGDDWSDVCAKLNGRGVESMHATREQLFGVNGAGTAKRFGDGARAGKVRRQKATKRDKQAVKGREKRVKSKVAEPSGRGNDVARPSRRRVRTRNR